MISKMCNNSLEFIVFSLTLVIAMLIAVNYYNFDDTVYKTVETRNGAVRGILNKTIFNQKPFYSFIGIPFAEPPVGELRFKPPKPAKSWRPKTVDAFEYSLPCSQIKFTHFDTNSTEDCLYVNVFVPVTSVNRKLPVMIYIFGGQFIRGSGNDQLIGPDFLMEKDIILATFNFRIGVFGYMSLGTPEYSGNMGLKDEQLGIKWIHDNIEYFGGDNSRITLAGHSSGSFSVSHHSLNDESKKHFQQSIALSGTAQSYHGFVKGNHQCLIRKLAKRLKPSIGDSTEELIEFLKYAPVEDLIDFSMQVYIESGHDGNTVWYPLIEEKNALQPFLTEDPNEKLENLDSLNITSYFASTNREYLMMATKDFTDSKAIDEYLNDFHVKLPINGYDLDISRKPYLKDLMNELRDYIFGNATTNFERIDQRLIMDGDFMFTYFINKWLLKQIQVSSKDTYYHEFSVDSTLFLNPKGISFPGSSHGDELCYLFRSREKMETYKNMIETRDADPTTILNFITIEHMTTLISNFVKFGKPSINGHPVKDFKPYQLNDFSFLNITQEGLIMGKSTNIRRVQFYDYFISEAKRLVEEHGDEPKQTVIDRFCERFQ